jgi:hypothetical protein
VGIADFQDRLAIGVENGNRAAVRAFHNRASQHVNQNRIRHVVSPSPPYLIRSRIDT